MCVPQELEHAIQLLRELALQAQAAGHGERALRLELLAEEYEAELVLSTASGLG